MPGAGLCLAGLPRGNLDHEGSLPRVSGAGGIPSSPSLSIYPAGQSSIFVGFSTGSNPVEQIKTVPSPSQYEDDQVVERDLLMITWSLHAGTWEGGRLPHSSLPSDWLSRGRAAERGKVHRSQVPCPADRDPSTGFTAATVTAGESSRRLPAGSSPLSWHPRLRAASPHRPFPSSRPRTRGRNSKRPVARERCGDRRAGRSFRPSRFQRGDRIQAVVKLRVGGGGEILLTTTEVVAVNALPAVTDIRIEPLSPITGSDGTGGRPGPGTGRRPADVQIPVVRGQPCRSRRRRFVDSQRSEKGVRWSTSR